MLIWINGAFGCPARRWSPTSFSVGCGVRTWADPEVLGFALHKMLPPSARQDFQDLPQWRSGVLATLIDAEAACDGELIVPMSIVRDDYFDGVLGGLRATGIDVRHYALTATADTLHRRLRRRSSYLIGQRWDETRPGRSNRSSGASRRSPARVMPPTVGPTTHPR
jgi:hypothetical protein